MPPHRRNHNRTVWLAQAAVDALEAHKERQERNGPMLALRGRNTPSSSSRARGMRTEIRNDEGFELGHRPVTLRCQV